MLITNATVVTCEEPNRVLPNHAVLISGERIADVGPADRLEKLHPRARKLDAGAQLLLPGLICAHTHFHRAFGRGAAWPSPEPGDLPAIFRDRWWRLDDALREEDIRFSTLLSLVDAIRNGVTTLFDHHASPNAIDGSLDIIGETVIRSGLRGVLCYEVTDRDGTAVADAGIKENVRFLKRAMAGAESHLAGMFGLHASFTLSGATLQACRAAAPDGAGFHVHVAEHEVDEYDSVHKTRMRAVDRLQNHGVLGDHSIAAHCVHVDAQESLLLRQTGTWVSHQPRSDMETAAGVAPVESLMRLGIRVCLGTDGLSHSMWDECKAAYGLPKAASRDPRRMSASQVSRLAIYNNAALASLYFPGLSLGQISPGAAADLILVDYDPPTPLIAENVDQHLALGVQSGMVTTTMVAGEFLMRDRQFVSLDEAEIAARGRELARRVWRRMEEPSQP
jgi:putative selenium metabolism protein SsnA